jgi:hypothetical protein
MQVVDAFTILSLSMEANYYSSVSEAIKLLSDEQTVFLHSYWRRGIFVYNPSVDTSNILSLDFTLDPTSIELLSGSMIQLIKNVLSSKVIKILTRALVYSTIWFSGGPDYVSTSLDQGLSKVDLLWKIGQSLQKRLPDLLCDRELSGVYAYQYNNLPVRYGKPKTSLSDGGQDVHVYSCFKSVTLYLSHFSSHVNGSKGGTRYYDFQSHIDWNVDDLNSNPLFLREWLLKNKVQTFDLDHTLNTAVVSPCNVVRESRNWEYNQGYLNRPLELTFLYGHAADEECYSPSQNHLS